MFFFFTKQDSSNKRSVYQNLLSYVIFKDLSAINTAYTVFRNVMPSSLARPKPANISDHLVQSNKTRAEAQQLRCNYDAYSSQDFHSLDAKMLSDSEFWVILRREKAVITVRPISPLVQQVFVHIPRRSFHLLLKVKCHSLMESTYRGDS